VYLEEGQSPNQHPKSTAGVLFLHINDGTLSSLCHDLHEFVVLDSFTRRADCLQQLINLRVGQRFANLKSSTTEQTSHA
jgi:hypothetical protein